MVAIQKCLNWQSIVLCQHCCSYGCTFKKEKNRWVVWNNLPRVFSREVGTTPFCFTTLPTGNTPSSYGNIATYRTSPSPVMTDSKWRTKALRSIKIMFVGLSWYKNGTQKPLPNPSSEVILVSPQRSSCFAKHSLRHRQSGASQRKWSLRVPYRAGEFLLLFRDC